MNICNFLRMLVAVCAFASATQASGAPILLVDGNGILTGANNVNVAGTLYNVKFGDSSCNLLFNGCSISAFDFKTEEAAIVAAQALLDQVFLNGLSGNFDTEPNKTLGCTYTDMCVVSIPYSCCDVYGRYDGRSAYNKNTVASSDTTLYGVGYISGGSDFNTASPDDIDFVTFARFQLASSSSADVPEPSSAALMCLAMAGLAFLRRRKA